MIEASQDARKNRGTTRRQARIAAAACLLALAAAGCEEEKHAPGPVPVKVKVLGNEQILVSRRFSGSVEPLQTTSLTFKLSGTVQKLHRPEGLDRDVQVGDLLARGTVIAELDEGDLRRALDGSEARVAQLEARVATAKDNLEIAARVLERFDRTAGSVSEVARDEAAARRVLAAGERASAEHALADARVQLDQAKDDYANRLLVVPFDNATVAEKRIEPGERKAAHEPCFRLIDISSVHITFGVPDTMIGDPAIGRSATDRVHLGRKLRVTADAFEGRSLEATVTKIAPQADPLTRSFLTELTLPNPVLPGGQPLLRPGMIVTVQVGAENDRLVLLLPMGAIHRGGSAGELMVYEAVVEDGREVVRARTVSAGDVFNNQIEVLPSTSQVKPGSRVVVTTAERLADGLAVRLIRDDTTTPAAR